MKPKLVIYGAGCLGSAVAVAYRDHGKLNDFDLVGFIDNNKIGSCVGFPIIGKEAIFPSLKKDGIENVVVAISDSVKRMQSCSKLEDMKFSFPTISPVLPREVKVGKGCFIDDSAVFLGIGQEVGDFCAIGPYVVIEGEVKLGRGTYLCPHTFVGAYSHIGDRTIFYPFSGCKPHVKIGRDCVVGPQIFVRKDLEAGKKKLTDRR